MVIYFKEKHILDIGNNIMKLPFNEEKINKNTFIRIFDEKTDEMHFVWHKDREDRIISSINNTDWKIQIDNELPIYITGEIFIPKEVYHRLIKGNGNLLLKVIKLD